MIENSAKGETKIHNARFYNLSPRAINALAFNKNSCKLAVSRHDASIEIWDAKYAVYLEKIILGLPEMSVEAIGWVNDRLFSTGHSGELIEWNLKTLEIKQKVLLTGFAAWCMDINKAQDSIAVGTEEGFLNIFSVDDDELNYTRIFDKQEGRILCCKYDHTGDVLVTGSMDAIRVWNVKTGQAVYKMATGRSEAKKETYVWSLAVLKDLTIISGDSRGRITIWDGKIGAQLESIPVLKADVLTVAVNEDETTLCCSGIDPIIKMFVLTPVKKENVVTNKWIKFIQRSVHNHDVKALTFMGSKVFSGGIDGYLGVSFSTKSKQTLTKYGPFLQQPCAVVAKTARMLLLKYFNYMELWQLGSASETVQLCDDEADKSKFLGLEKGLIKLLEMKSINEEPIVSCSISSDGLWLAYSTYSTIRLFKVIIENDKAEKVVRVRNVPDTFSPATKIVFSGKSQLFLVKSNGSIDFFSITSDDEVEFCETLDTSKIVKDTLSHVIMSDCGKYLVCAGTCCIIAVWKAANKKKFQWKHLLNLPKYHIAPVAIAIHKNRPRLVATFSDLKIFEYDLEEMKFTASTNKKYFTNVETHAIRNIVLDPRNENAVILHNDSYLLVLTKTESKNEAKMRRIDTDPSDDEISDYKLKFYKQYQHFVHLDWLSSSEMVAVDVNPVTLIEQLPPALRRKKFGVS